MQETIDRIMEAIVHNGLLIGIGLMIIALIMYLSGATPETFLWFLFPGGIATLMGVVGRI